MSDGVVSMGQFGVGFRADLARVREERKYDQWYSGNYTSLMPSNSIPTGRALINVADLVKFPVFSLADQFYLDGVMSERPSWDPESAANAWLDGNQDRLFRAMEQAVLFWMRKGRFILVVEADGTIQPIDPSSYVRVGSFERPDELVGHIIFYTWYEASAQELLLPGLIREPNRIRVTKFSQRENINTVQTFMYAGGIIGAAVGAPAQAGLRYICVEGDGYTYYPEVAGMAGRFMLQLTNTDGLLNEILNAARVVPPGGLPSARPGQIITPEDQVRNLRETVRPIWISGGGPNGQDAYYMTPPGDYAANEAFLTLLVQFISIVTGATLNNFGIGLADNASGVSQEKAQTRAIARGTRIRRAILKCLAPLIIAAGAPMAEVEFAWAAQVFETRDAFHARIVSDLAAGIIPVELAQKLLGYEVTGPTRQADNEGGTNG